MCIDTHTYVYVYICTILTDKFVKIFYKIAIIQHMLSLIRNVKVCAIYIPFCSHNNILVDSIFPYVFMYLVLTFFTWCIHTAFQTFNIIPFSLRVLLLQKYKGTHFFELLKNIFQISLCFLIAWLNKYYFASHSLFLKYV